MPAKRVSGIAPMVEFVLAIDREHSTTSKAYDRYRNALAAFREAERDKTVLAAHVDKWVDGVPRARMLKYTAPAQNEKRK